MIHVGIDYGVQSPALCILNPFTYKYFFYFFPQRKREIDFLEEGDNWRITALPYIKDKNWISREERYDFIADTFIDKILVHDQNDNEIDIGIEGYSLNSRGRSISLSCEAGAVIRHKLYKHDFEFKEFAPTEIKKKFTGKGNSGKADMYNSFCMNENVVALNLYDELGLKYDVYAEIPKPIEDLVDAYAIVHCLLDLPALESKKESRVQNLIKKI